MSNDLIAEMQREVAEAVAKAKCQYLQLAATIMRECDQPGMADDIDQVRYSLANRVRDSRKGDSQIPAPPSLIPSATMPEPVPVAGEPIPESERQQANTNFIKGSTGEYEAAAAERERKAERRARIDECNQLKDWIVGIGGQTHNSDAVELVEDRIRELEAEEE